MSAFFVSSSCSVMPAKAGIQDKRIWIPAGVYPEHSRRAGMTVQQAIQQVVLLANRAVPIAMGTKSDKGKKTARFK